VPDERDCAEESSATVGQDVGGRGSRAAAQVLVVGAGVSGCACAATIATLGIGVTVVGMALDSVGLPRFGPVVDEGPGCVERVSGALRAVPTVLADVWLDACLVPEGRGDCVAVDRRRVSVETKRALEGVPGLRFRQGLVVGLRSGGRLVVETAFGEALEADVVVLATGLSLGGRVTVGAQDSVGGGYGETPSEGLRQALQALGAEWRGVAQSVPARRGAWSGGVAEGADADLLECGGEATGDGFRWCGPTGLRELVRRGADAVEGAGENGNAGSPRTEWAVGNPPSPYFGDVCDGAPFVYRVSEEEEDGAPWWPAVPDGLATNEVATPEGGERGVRWSWVGNVTRPAQVVQGLTIANVDPMGRWIPRDGESVRLYVAGRARGATGYVESLTSGIQVGRAVVEDLRGRMDDSDGPAWPSGGGVTKE
jgi:hypothetical protein